MQQTENQNANIEIDEVQMPIANHARSATSPTRLALSANKPCLDVAALLNQCEIRRNEIHPTTSQVRSNGNPIPARSSAHTAKESKQFDLKFKVRIIEIQIS